MPATPLTVRTITPAGIAPGTPTAGDPTNGNSYVNSKTTWVELDGGGAGGTVTVTTPGTVGGNAIEDKSITLAASEKKRIHLDPKVYGDVVTLTPSVNTITLHVFQI